VKFDWNICTFHRGRRGRDHLVLNPWLLWKFTLSTPLYRLVLPLSLRGRRGRDHMVVGCTTTYAIKCLSPLMLWVRISIRARCTPLCDKVCRWLATDRWFFPGPPVSSTNKTDRHDITEILFKVSLNTIKQTFAHL
jgi:hypothetical protein